MQNKRTKTLLGALRHCSCSISPGVAVHLKCVKATLIKILKCDASGNRTVFLVHLSICVNSEDCDQPIAAEVICALRLSPA